MSLGALIRPLRKRRGYPGTLARPRDYQEGQHDVVVLGNGELSKPLRISAHRFTKSAREKIEKAGGAITEIAAKATFTRQAANKS